VDWDSPLITGLAAAALALSALCVVQERRASEPILPPRLFADRIFLVASLVNILTSITMLGGIVFMPLFLQLVYGLGAGDSGLMLIPFTGATVVTAIGAGRLMAATGRYKIFPVVGAALILAAMLWLSTLTPTTPLVLAGSAMALWGFGIGLIMPILVVVVQNTVENRDLGTATASISFFRTMGGSFGVALFSAVLIARLNSLVGAVPGHAVLGASPGVALLHAGAQALDLAPSAIRAAVAAAITSAFQDTLLIGAGLALLAFMLALMLREVPLRTTVGRSAGEGQDAAGATGVAGLAD
jgi:predicted MFS family arabinose efflux permease